MIDQFRSRLDDIKTVVNYQSQLMALKWAMTEEKKVAPPEEDAKIDKALVTIDAIMASMTQTVAKIDQAMADLA